MEEKKKRGFAAMDPAAQREIARKGGKAAHAAGTAHEFTPEEARIAGRKGGEQVSKRKDHMALIGRKGGLRKRENLFENRLHESLPSVPGESK